MMLGSWVTAALTVVSLAAPACSNNESTGGAGGPDGSTSDGGVLVNVETTRQGGAPIAPETECVVTTAEARSTTADRKRRPATGWCP